MAEKQQAVTPEIRDRFGWAHAKVDGLPVKAWIGIGLAIAAVVLGFGALWTYVLNRDTEMGTTAGMGNDQMAAAGAVAFPPVHGFDDGEDILFIHTEASDPQVAGMLTDMMGSPVEVVPELAEIPESALANVYVFTNGVRPHDARGPFGFQADVFDSAPGDEDYSPLRAVSLVTWVDEADARVLRSAAEVGAAVAEGEARIETPGIVVNMPFLRWPGGRR
ncbi:MAG: DUF7482 domain-containing protein [Actinomycetota bacterium]